jgi:hypothetical protein
VVGVQPGSDVVGSSLNTLTTVEIRDITDSVVVFGSGEVSVSLFGSLTPRCPLNSRTLPLSRIELDKIWEEFSIFRTISFDEEETMDFHEFKAMLLENLDLTAVVDDDFRYLFAIFDTGGALDSELVPLRDNLLSRSEFMNASLGCICLNGWAAGYFEYQIVDIDSPQQVVVKQTGECRPLAKCAEGYLGRTCRLANSMVPRMVLRNEPLRGTLSAKIVDGVATFTDLAVLEAGEGFEFLFSSHGKQVRSRPFTILPGPPVKGIILAPANGQTYLAGEIIPLIVALTDENDNSQPNAIAVVDIEHINVSAYSSTCSNSSQILTCDSCPDLDIQICPGPRCPFRCDYTNVVRPRSLQDPTPWGQHCAYNCKKGCSFMCGTLRGIPFEAGIADMRDTRIKRVGTHALRANVPSADYNESAPIDWEKQRRTQRQIVGRLLMMRSSALEERLTSTFDVVHSEAFYLVNDHATVNEWLMSNETRAGTEIRPYPTCLVTDFYGNLVTNTRHRIGLSIRDSDQDEYDYATAEQKYKVWPVETQYPLAENILANFTFSDIERANRADDELGCPPIGTPVQGCPLVDSAVTSLIQRDRTISWQWCPSTQERRHCRGCLTAERLFESINRTHWKQTYEFVDHTIIGGSPQLRGAFDCPDARICRADGTACGCAVLLVNATGEREFDLCKQCSERYSVDGMPVALTFNGKAVFRNITCSKPRRGYRFRCIQPPGGQGTFAQPRLRDVEWDLATSRGPAQSFIQDSTWGKYKQTVAMAWTDMSGNSHPQAEECTLKCANNTPVVLKRGEPGAETTTRLFFPLPTCPSFCWKFAYPVSHNPSFAYVPPESPALSMPFTVRAGDVKNLLITRPLPENYVVTEDIIRVGGNQTSFWSYCPDPAYTGPDPVPQIPCDAVWPSFQMSDKFDNPNRTNVGSAFALLVPGPDNPGAEMTGQLTVGVTAGKPVFPVLRIACPGLQYRLRFAYRRWMYGHLNSASNNIAGMSLAFNVLPPAPRLAGVHFSNSWTDIIFRFDTSTDRAAMQSNAVNCHAMIAGLGVYNVSTGVVDVIPACNGTTFDDPATVRCPKTHPILGVNEPQCSWSDNMTFVLQLGANATLDYHDYVFLRTMRAGGPLIRTAITLKGVVLTSPPAELRPEDQCVGGVCGGLPITPNDVLEEDVWACAIAPPPTPGVPVTVQMDPCVARIGGPHIRDSVYFEVRSCMRVSCCNNVRVSYPPVPAPAAFTLAFLLGVLIETLHLRRKLCVYLCMYVCMHACLYACMHVCMYVSLYACMCVYVCMISMARVCTV